ncbi:MAG: DUF2851 family protein [Chitinophagaceae bacterium]
MAFSSRLTTRSFLNLILMTERLLQFIWQFQYLNRHDLCTDDSAVLQIIHPGKYNTNQGPDFLEASIKIDGTLLVGNIELHVKSSDWNKHGHHTDSNYKNVILHVVWQHDVEKQPPPVPVLVLQNRVSVLLLTQYDEWMQKASFVPCSAAVKEVNELVWTSWIERLLAERLLRKSGYVLQLLHHNNHHWEETCWQLLARNFGIQINADSFENIARSLPVTILAKHKNQVTVLEALLLGQAGLLAENFVDDYARLLQREYLFHQHKYKLTKPAGNVYFLRMRPAAFPAIRLAQLAVLVNRSTHLFAAIKETVDLKGLMALLNVSANDYWHYHYRFDELADYKIKNLGDSMINNIIINTVAPILFAYGLYHKEESLKDKALQWLTETTPEKNNITKGWHDMGIPIKQAYHSQALIELKTRYCDKKRCLDCAVGNALLKRNI